MQEPKPQDRSSSTERTGSADLANVVHEAALLAADRGHEQMGRRESLEVRLEGQNELHPASPRKAFAR